jgi:Dual-action HEIGH metallo-peptidase
MKMKFFLACVTLSIVLFSCQKENKTPMTSINNIPNDIINKIQAQGLSTDGVIATNGGYLVEGDIFLSNEALSTPNIGPVLRVGDEEQYHTTNLITGLPRTITVSISGLSSIFVSATDSAIARYNAQNLRVHFTRVTSGGQINIVGADLGGGGILGQSAGFPNANGNPASPITLNTHSGTFTGANVQYLATIIAHEVGHCIGFRHTDFRNRSFSCGGIKVNEGQAGVGAILIPGTPKSARDPGSWMLACISFNENRPFNPNDIIALNFLF